MSILLKSTFTQTIIEAKGTAIRFTEEILEWVEKLACAFGGSESGRFVSQTWENMAEIRLVPRRLPWRVIDV